TNILVPEDGQIPMTKSTLFEDDMIETKQARYGLSKQGNDLPEEDREQPRQDLPPENY
ncbi:138_t:CDS:2, partial [Gigaspora margarita]